MSVENIVIQNSTESFISQLRSRTAVSHQNLENLPVSVSLISKTITIPHYSNYLNVMLDVIKDIEKIIFPILKDIIPDLDNRRKTHLLEQDLLFLNYQKQQTLSPITDALVKFTIPYALGIMYVTEGSTLGGRYILKNIESVFGYNENNGAVYFAGYGNKSGSYWKSFLNILTQYEIDNKCAEEIINGANYAFTSIYRHFLENNRNDKN